MTIFVTAVMDPRFSSHMELTACQQVAASCLLRKR